MIRITAKKDGFRRCGIAHSKTAVDYPDSKFEKDQLEILKKEPMLVVQELEGETKPAKNNTRPKAEDLIAAIGKAETVEALNEILPEGEDRKTVLEAYQKRGEELSK